MEKNKKIYFVDIVYYNAYCFYRRYEKDLNEYSGQLITALCLSLNIELSILLIEYFFSITLFKNKWQALYVLIPIAVLIFYRYNKMISIIEIEDGLSFKEKNKVRRLNIIASIYLLLSFFGTIFLAIILGELNNPPPFWENWFK